jgi:hypothetical protein
MADYRRDLIKILNEHNCVLVRHGKGSHGLWESPINKARFVVQHDLSSRIAANNIPQASGFT